MVAGSGRTERWAAGSSGTDRHLGQVFCSRVPPVWDRLRFQTWRTSAGLLLAILRPRVPVITVSLRRRGQLHPRVWTRIGAAGICLAACIRRDLRSRGPIKALADFKTCTGTPLTWVDVCSSDDLGMYLACVWLGQADRVWAEWITWVLEEDLHLVLVQARDFVPGSSWTQ